MLITDRETQQRFELANECRIVHPRWILQSGLARRNTVRPVLGYHESFRLSKSLRCVCAGRCLCCAVPAPCNACVTYVFECVSNACICCIDVTRRSYSDTDASAFSISSTQLRQFFSPFTALRRSGARPASKYSTAPSQSLASSAISPESK